MKRSYRHVWCSWMPSLLCESSSHESCGFSHVSPRHLTLRTSWHTLSKKCFSLVWFSHFSSIHLILRSSWQTLSIHSFSTCRGHFIIISFIHLMKRSYCHILCTSMLSLPCESSHETSSVGAFFVSSCHLTLRSSCHTFCIVSLLCGLSCVINSPDPEKLIADFEHP